MARRRHEAASVEALLPRVVESLRRTSLRARVAAAVATGVLVLGAVLLTNAPTGSEATTVGDRCSGRAGEPDGADGWGGCWPGPLSTGVPEGTILTRVPADATSGPGWTWDATDRIVVVVEDDAVIDRLDVDGGFYIRSIGAKIVKSKATFLITASGTSANFCRPDESQLIRKITKCSVLAGTSNDTTLPSTARRTTLEDSELNYRGSPGNGGQCVVGRNIDVRRTEVQGCENGFSVDSYASIVDSYVHDLFNSSAGDPHTDGLQSEIGRHLYVEHNVFFGFSAGCRFPNENGSCNGTSAINIGGQRDVATVADSVVKRNLLAGGAYTMYCPLLPPTNFVVSENRFSTVFTDTAPNPADRVRVGEYGPQDGCDRHGVTATDNRLFDHATKVTRAAPLFGGAGSPPRS